MYITERLEEGLSEVPSCPKIPLTHLLGYVLFQNSSATQNLMKQEDSIPHYHSIQHSAFPLPHSIWCHGCLPGSTVNRSEEWMNISSQHIGFVLLVVLTTEHLQWVWETVLLFQGLALVESFTSGSLLYLTTPSTTPLCPKLLSSIFYSRCLSVFSILIKKQIKKTN